MPDLHMNRKARRAMRGKAAPAAALMAACCFDFQNGEARPIKDPPAVAALARAFELMIRAGGKPVAIPISEAAALGFPERKADNLPGGVTWLAVGTDLQGRGSYALHSAQSADRAHAHEAARALALAHLAEVCATVGFPRDFRTGRQARG